MEVLGNGADEMISSLHAIRRAFPLPAAVDIVHEQTFAERTEIIKNEMVYHPVAKTTGEYFPLDRIFTDKTNAVGNLIRPVSEFLVQSEKLLLKIELEAQGIVRASFVSARVKIRLEKIAYQ